MVRRAVPTRGPARLKYAKVSVKRPGPMRSAMPRRLPSNPWSRPCSVDATWRVISPCDADHDNPQRDSSTTGRRVAAEEADDERGQHGRDEAEGEHVKQDGDEDEGERGRAAHPDIRPAFTVILLWTEAGETAAPRWRSAARGRWAGAP